jgi:hypothetical protein
MRLADNAAGSVQKERPFVDVLQLGYLRDDMIRTGAIFHPDRSDAFLFGGGTTVSNRG